MLFRAEPFPFQATRNRVKGVKKDKVPGKIYHNDGTGTKKYSLKMLTCPMAFTLKNKMCPMPLGLKKLLSHGSTSTYFGIVTKLQKGQTIRLDVR